MNLLFVCTGNTCRSPMAEGIFNVYAKDLDAKSISAGINVLSAMPPCENAVIAAGEYSADISQHRSQRIDEKMMDDSDIVLCMTNGHQKVLSLMYPQYAKKIKCLDKIDIADPFGGDLEAYRHTAAQLERAIRRLQIGGK